VAWGERQEGIELVVKAFPACRTCGQGDLLPLSDAGSQGAMMKYKAWVCTNPSCLFNRKIRHSDIIFHELGSSGPLHTSQRMDRTERQ
jgi:hypothetical protein